MRSVIGILALVTVLSFTIWAQEPAGRGQGRGGGRGQGGQGGGQGAAQGGGQRQNQTPPPESGVVSAADIAALVARQPTDRNGNGALLRLAPYSVNMEHRVNVPQNASIHDKEAELFYVINGGGTIVTGGKLINPTKNGDNSSGSGIEGGTAKKISKGDFVLVKEGEPHWFSVIDGELTLMSMHLPRAAGAN